MLDDDFIIELSDVLINIYERKRQQAISNGYYSVKDRTPFIKLAKQIIENKADPYDWINACFDAYKPIPYPNMLIGMTAAGIYKLYKQKLNNNIELLFKLQGDTYTTQINLGKSPIDILNNIMLPMSALFRYAIAVDLGLNDVQNRFYNEAKEQYFLNPAYSKLIKKTDKNLWTKLEVLLNQKN